MKCTEGYFRGTINFRYPGRFILSECDPVGIRHIFILHSYMETQKPFYDKQMIASHIWMETSTSGDGYVYKDIDGCFASLLSQHSHSQNLPSTTQNPSHSHSVNTISLPAGIAGQTAKIINNSPAPITIKSGGHAAITLNGASIKFFEGGEVKFLGDFLGSVECEHEFVEYIGLTNRFNYCKKCDQKQSENT